MCQNGKALNFHLNGESIHMNDIKLASLDLAKNKFQLCLTDTDNQVIKNQKIKRARVLDRIRQLPEGTKIAMEACASAHYWARQFQAMGYEVLLIPAQHVKPFVGKQKNDANDARAIAEAACRPQLYLVPVKTIEQQDIKVVRSSRERLVKVRTALVNHLRGHCGEYGVVMPQGIGQFRKRVASVLEDADNGISVTMREILSQGYEEFVELDDKIKALEKQQQQLCQTNEDYGRLLEIPGVGPMNAAAIISEIGDGSQFSSGREYAAFCGLVPRQHSSGEKTIMSGITKNGNRQLRTLLVHSARTLVRYMEKKNDALSRWVKEIAARRGKNKAIVALANKLARVCWAVLFHKTRYQAELVSAR
jgi:transposase